ncbi:hypothetical protein [Patulibacter sp.]|uniref:hypothetical protein n=1 Tax=Patulibacter sp. TaxID=1912859 RepID=UPI00271F209C|nr:hypothetical protein [Patulibacter sp.]MDO9408735.1 hypothetical protein [Patulibacter sp.]
MSPPNRRPLVAIAVALLTLLAAAPAGASDAGLRELVAGAGPVRERVERDLRSVGATPTTSVAAAVRHLRRAGRIHDRARRTVVGLRGEFVAERADTPLAAEGRTLVLDGLGDLGLAVGRLARADRVAVTRLSRARSEAAVRRAARSYERTGRSAARLAERGYGRAERGGRLLAIAR